MSDQVAESHFEVKELLRKCLERIVFEKRCEGNGHCGPACQVHDRWLWQDRLLGATTGLVNICQWIV